MSKPKDPKDTAIDYVMRQPIAEAQLFVQTLASIVKSRAQLLTTAKGEAKGKADSAAASTPRPRTAAAPKEPAPARGRIAEPAQDGSLPALGVEVGTSAPN